MGANAASDTDWRLALGSAPGILARRLGSDTAASRTRSSGVGPASADTDGFSSSAMREAEASPTLPSKKASASDASLRPACNEQHQRYDRLGGSIQCRLLTAANISHSLQQASST